MPGTASIWNPAVFPDPETILRQDLANIALAAKGVGLVGFSHSNVYAAGTVGKALNMFLNVKNSPFNAVGDNVTNDTAAINAANAAGTGVFYPPTGYVGDNLNNIYNLSANQCRVSLFGRIQSGTDASPTTLTAPVLWVQKITSSNAAGVATDQGALYAASIKKSGDSEVIGATSFVYYAGGSGGVIAHHARATVGGNFGNAYAGWFYIDNRNAALGFAWQGMEINGYTVVDAGYGGFGQLLRICMADNDNIVNRASTGISFGQNTVGTTSATRGSFYTGIRFERDCIVQSAGVLGDSEAIRIDLPIASNGGIGGLRFAKGNAGDVGLFKFALRTDEISFVGNTAILLGTPHFIRWGSTTANTWIVGGADDIVSVGTTVDIFPEPTIPTEAIRVNSTPVLGPRKGGWAATTGTLLRTNFGDASLSDTSQVLRALITDIKAHGAIGA